MRASAWLGLVALWYATPALAQGPCSSAALPEAARAVSSVRRSLRTQTVGLNDPTVPPAVAAQLVRLKDRLADSVVAVFACADSATTSESVQQRLTEALHLTDDAFTAPAAETGRSRDTGTYGADLSVQVFQLFGRPKLFEVDFRWSIECGDDHLLMIFEAADDHAAHAWRERLRWAAAPYTNVAGALGDFVTLSPLTGDYKAPTWRFLVAHGHPGCAAAPRPSQFDLDLLAPSADAGKPHVDWHFEHAYVQDRVEPTLATTEDTVDFRIVHQPLAESSATPLPAPDVYRFHLTAGGQVEPSPSATGEGSPGTTPKAPTTSLPQ